MKKKIKKLLSEPYIQFFLAGIVIYMLFSLMAPSKQTLRSQKEIVVTRGAQQHLKDLFMQAWHRPPTQDELALLIEAYYNEEMMIDEALALHLERHDTTIRKALLKKVRHIITASVTVEEPDEATLYRYYQAHIDRYSRMERIHFFHIFASFKQKRGMENLAHILKKYPLPPQNVKGYGEPFPDGNDIGPIEKEKLEKLFGHYFSGQISHIPEKRWVGPLHSSKGLHLVYIVEKKGKEALPFDEIETRVYQEYLEEYREKALAASMQKIVRGYRKKVE